MAPDNTSAPRKVREDTMEAQPDATGGTVSGSGSLDPTDQDIVLLGDLTAHNSKKDAETNMLGELLKLGTIMDFGQDFHGGRSRERKKPQELLNLEKAKEKEMEERERQKQRLEEKRKQREAQKAAREAVEDERARASERPAEDEEEKPTARAEKRKMSQVKCSVGASSSSAAAPQPPQPQQRSRPPRKEAVEEKRDEEKKDEKKEQRRETEEQKLLVMERMQPLQQLLMLGFLPEEADLTTWSDFGTLTNGALEIRSSRVRKIIGGYALGRGLFACRDFAQNELITVYGGELITSDEAKVRKDDGQRQSKRYLMRISDSDFLVDGWQYAAGISDDPGANTRTA